VRVEEVPVTALLVAEHRPPERHHLGSGERVDRDLNGLRGGRIGGDRGFQLTREFMQLPRSGDTVYGFVAGAACRAWPTIRRTAACQSYGKPSTLNRM
jgi:hypothetical protein